MYKEPWKKEYMREFFDRHLAEFREEEIKPYEDKEKEDQFKLYKEAYPIEKFNRWIIGDLKHGEEQERQNNPGYFLEFRNAFPLGLQ